MEIEEKKIEKALERFDDTPKTLADFFYLIRNILKNWIDFQQEEYYDIVALWILGTYLHDKFISYPYLFINAMKRSGKSRLLFLISKLARNGMMTTSLTEAVLFRLPNIKKVTLCIDEFENISVKGKEALRELLNSGYKKGLEIHRMRKNPLTNQQEIESFNVYTPVAIANISGIDDVLSDRCVTVVIERSERKEIINKMELFDEDYMIKTFHNSISNLVQRCTFDSVHTLYEPALKELRSDVAHQTSNTTLYTSIINNNTSVSLTDNIYKSQFDTPSYIKIRENGIFGRDLEVWYPILWLAKNVCTPGYTIFENLLPFIFKITQEKLESDIVENRDTVLIAFLYNYVESNNFIRIKEICDAFQQEDPQEKWFNPNWVGRALKRSNLTLEKRRLKRGFEVRLNLEKLEIMAKKLGIQKEKSESSEEQQTIKDVPDLADYVANP